MQTKRRRGIVSDSIFLASVRVITTILSLITTKVVCTLISKVEYGTYSQVMLLISTISSITILGMTDGINYFYNRYNGEKKSKEYVATIFGLQIFVSVIGIIAVFAGKSVLVDYFGNNRLDKLLVFAGILPLMLNILSMLQVLFISIGKAKQIAYRNFIVSFLNLILFSIGAYFVREVFVLLIFTVILDSIQIVYFIVSLKKNGLSIKFSDVRVEYVQRILIYCIPMAMFILTNSLSRDLDKYIISAFTDTETLALYTNAAKILPFDILMTSFVTVLIPILTRTLGEKDFEKARLTYRNFLTLSCLTTTLFAAGVIPLAPEAMSFLYSDKYVEGYPIFIIYILIDIVRFMSLSLVLSAAGQSKILMKISVGSLVMNLFLSIVMYRIIGIIGPAIATLIIMILTGLITLQQSAKVMGESILHILELKNLTKSSCLIIVICFLEWILKSGINRFIFNDFLILSLCYGTYFVVAVFFLKNKIAFYFKSLNHV